MNQSAAEEAPWRAAWAEHSWSAEDVGNWSDQDAVTQVGRDLETGRKSRPRERQYCSNALRKAEHIW